MTNEISTASGEQTEGIEQVTKAINEMNHITQQNAASSEETASSSEEMSAQAQTLMNHIKVLSGKLSGTKKSQTDPEKRGVKGNTTQTSKSIGTQVKMLKQHAINDMPYANARTNGDNKNSPQQMTNQDQWIPMGDDKVVEHTVRLKDV